MISKQTYISQKETYYKNTLSARPPLCPVKQPMQPMFQPGRPCWNHKDKVSTFTIQTEGVPLYYCQKCALHLASQGFSVEKLERQDPLQLTIQCLNSRKCYLKKDISRVTDYYSRVSNNLDAYFDKIIQSINLKRNQFQMFVSRQQEMSLESNKSMFRQIEEVLATHKQAKSSDRTTRNTQLIQKEIKNLWARVQKLGQETTETFDIVTIDLASISEIITSNLKIKVEIPLRESMTSESQQGSYLYERSLCNANYYQTQQYEMSQQ